jgi:pimeloyl-ACP methyl ester carboxylesterase
MFEQLISDASKNLTESTSISLADQIEFQPITTPLSFQPITTSFVCQGSNQPPILLLHGFDSSVFEWRRLFPLLAASQTTWAVDLLGFGFTQRLDELKFTPSAIHTHLYSFWQSLINQPVILVGASMGGATAIDFALTYPQAVSKLVLIDSAGLANKPIVSRFMFSPLDRWATNFLSNSKVRQNISRAAYFDKYFASDDALKCAAMHLECDNWSQALISFTRSGGYGSFSTQLSEIQSPSLILWGRNDKILGTQAAKKFDQGISNSRLVWIDQCGHVPHLEQPQKTANAILDFIRD